MSKRKSIRPKRTLFDNGRLGGNALRKRRLLFEPLEIRTTVSDSLLGLLSAEAILPDVPFAAEAETELVAGGSKGKSSSASREADELLAEFLEGEPADASASQTQGGASAAEASGPVAAESASDSDGALAPRDHGQIEPLALAASGEESLLGELDLAAMALLGGSGGSGGPPNYPPVANDDPYYEALHDRTRTIGQSDGLLHNDYDPFSQPISVDDADPLLAGIQPVSGPSHGTVELHSDGSFVYTPSPHYVGTDSFTYRITDGVYTDTAVATIAVINPHAPVAGNDSFTAVAGAELVINAPGVLQNDTDGDGDALTAVLATNPGHGSVTLNANGSFHYTPAGNYVGPDQFTYRANDGIASGNAATVTINVVRPVPDIDTDSDNNNVIERNDYEDSEELQAPGKVIPNNIDDDNGNGVEDRNDPGPFLDANTHQPVNDNELYVAMLSVPSVPGVDLTGFRLSLESDSSLKLWRTQDKQSLPESRTWVIGTDTIPGQIYVEGVDYGQGQVHWVLKSPAGAEISRDSVLFTVARTNLTAYRPQTEGPGYGSPFQRTAIPEANETSPGAGIRRNGDDDDFDGVADYQPMNQAIASENDLIEVTLEMQPCPAAGIKYYLERSNPNINVWGNRDKSDPLLVSYPPNNRVEITSPRTVWVEWATMDAGQSGADLELSAWDSRHNQKTAVTDVVHFYPFTSVVVAFGGFGSSPLNADTGPFQMAVDLYNDGYDVHAYSYSAWNTNAQQEVTNALDRRGVSNVAIFGHSWGGGATYDLATAVGRNIRFTAYIDAIVTGAVGIPGVVDPTPRTERPGPSAYHVSYYETRGWPPGAAGQADFQLNVNNTGWGTALDHNSIDNNDNVRGRILNGSAAGGIEGPHQGLRQRVPR